MRYRKELALSPENAIHYIKSRCNCSLSLFRILEMSFLPPKCFGVFCASSKRDTLYITINIKKTVGFNASRRHLRLKAIGENNHTTLTGRFFFSDFWVYVMVGIVFSLIAGINNHTTMIEYYLLYIAGFIGIWVLQSLVGSVVFRKEEKMLLDRIDSLCKELEAGCASSDKKQHRMGNCSLSQSEANGN